MTLRFAYLLRSSHTRRALPSLRGMLCGSTKRRLARMPVMRSIEPGEHWRWCYVDQLHDEGLSD